MRVVRDTPLKSPLTVNVRVPLAVPGVNVTLACLTPPAVNATLVELKVAVGPVPPQPAEHDRVTDPAAPLMLVTVITELLVFAGVPWMRLSELGLAETEKSTTLTVN